MQIGESFVGQGADAAHVNTVLGRRDGPVGSAFATALSTPTAGHAAFLVVAQPGIAVVPPTLFVNKATIVSDSHGILTWGPAQAGVAEGVGLALEGGLLDAAELDELVLIAAVWVSPSASNADAVFHNNRSATFGALRAGLTDGAGEAGESGLGAFLRVAKGAHNPYYPGPSPEVAQ